jgi:hypothetical protein
MFWAPVIENHSRDDFDIGRFLLHISYPCLIG